MFDIQSPETWKIQGRMDSAWDGMQVQNGTGQGVQESKRPLLASSTLHAKFLLEIVTREILSWTVTDIFCKIRFFNNEIYTTDIMIGVQSQVSSSSPQGFMTIPLNPSRINEAATFRKRYIYYGM